MKLLSVLFLLIAVFLHRPAMLGGYFSNAVTIFTRWDLALLAGAFAILQWNALIRVLKSFSKLEIICILILLFSALGHFFYNGYYTLESLGLNLIFLTVPLFACVNKMTFLRILPYFMSFLWLLTCIAFLTQRMRDIAGVGITGNWNWNATFLIITVPFMIYLIFKYLKKKNRLLPFLLSAVILIVTLILFAKSRSRAASIGLVLTLFLYLYLSLNTQKRKIILICGGIFFAAAIVLLTTRYTAKIDSFIAKEIRPAIWESTVNLIKDHPLGVGAESFEEKYIPYKTADYFMNQFASPRTIHPHNELLNIAALLGIPALIAWCFLTFKGLYLFIRRYKGTSAVMKISFFCFIAMLIHSMLDLIFFSWPQDIIGFTFAGIFWAPLMYVSRPQMKFRCLPRIIGTIAAIGVILSGLNNFRATLNFRRSFEASRKGDAVNAQKYALAGAALSLSFPEQLYLSAERALLFNKNYPLALKLAEMTEKTPYKNFSRIHTIKAMSLALLGRDGEAAAEYLLESKNYPYLILPRIGMITCYGRLGKTELIPPIEKELDELIKFRGLSVEDVRKIMIHPECDLNQHKLKELTQK